MKADLHVHTMYSKDGRTTMEELLQAAERFGIGCIAVTDHNVFKAYHELKDNGKVIIIPAEEVSSSEGHIVALGIDREIPARMSIQETIDAIHEAGGYAFAAHPYRWWSGLGEKNTLKYPFDGIEARNGRSIPSANRRSERLAKRIGKPMTAGSDAHSPHRIGEGYVLLPDGFTTWREVVDYIMTNDAPIVCSNSRHFIGTLRYGFKCIGQWMLRGFKRMRRPHPSSSEGLHGATGEDILRKAYLIGSCGPRFSLSCMPYFLSRRLASSTDSGGIHTDLLLYLLRPCPISPFSSSLSRVPKS